MSEPHTHIITAPEGDLHRLSVQRLDSLLYIRTNGRELWPDSSTAISPEMARQLIEGVTAVLEGADRAITPILLRLEQEELARRARPAATPADLSSYDNLFGESP